MVIGIVGVGLLGGSIGYILKKKGFASEVIGIGRNEERLKRAVELGAIDSFSLDFDSRLSVVDILIVAVPVTMIASFVKRAAPFLKEGAIITDVGSTKKTVTEEVEAILPPHLRFVGGHPMAGSEKTGVEALDPYLFENAYYVLTRSSKTDSEAFNDVKRMVNQLDATCIEMDVDLHDMSVAMISHAPHVVAAAMVNCAERVDNGTDRVLSLAAGGFKDTTRIASGSPEMWVDICTTNRDRIIDILDCLESDINDFKEAIKSADRERIKQLFSTAKKTRDSLPGRGKGFSSPMLEFILFVPDEPGIIGRISNILGDMRVNIKDIEVLHMREDEGGSIRIGVEYKDDSFKAVEKLKELGYEVKVVE